MHQRKNTFPPWGASLVSGVFLFCLGASLLGCPVHVSGIRLEKKRLTLEVGETETLHASVEPAHASNPTIVWTSSDPAVATVDAGGRIEALLPGAAEIRARTQDMGKVDVCILKITEASPKHFLAITGFSPTQAAHGATVRIQGKNFSPTASENNLSLNEVSARVLSATETELLVAVPRDMRCSGPIRLSVGGYTVSSPGLFSYIPTAFVSTLAGGERGKAGAVVGAEALYSPQGVAIDAAGHVYVADTFNHRIRKITPGGVVSHFAGNGQPGHVDGPGSQAQFYNPAGLSMDAAGNLYVADVGNHRIRKVSPQGVVSTLAGGAEGFADGAGGIARFRRPTGLALDAAGNLYIADTLNHRIRKITPGGTVSTVAGGVEGFADGRGGAARFSSPQGVAVDAAGNLYIADTFNHRIRKITPEGAVSTVAGGEQGFVDGMGAAARLNQPSGIATDAAGYVYIADTYNHSIRVIPPGGELTTLAGGPGEGGHAEGAGAKAKLSSPYGLAADTTTHQLYVADRNNHRIRKLVLE